MLRYAAERGYDQVAWTDGETQAARYDLSKEISRVELEETSGGIAVPPLHEPFDSGTLTAYDHNGKKVIEQYIPSPDELTDAIGKDVAEKLLAQKAMAGRRAGMGARVRTLSGLDLKVGGEGMKGFYDDILVRAANKLGKKYGARAGHAELETRRGETEAVHTLPLTPELKQAALAEGFPLFQGGRDEPVAAITGEEIAPREADLPTLRNAVRGWYRERLAGTSIDNPTLGAVRFGARGLDKAIAESANPLKLRLFPAVPKVIERGRYLGPAANRDASRRNILRYHWIEAEVRVGNAVHRVRVAVEEHTDGKIYYNHTLPDQIYFQGSAPAESPSKAGGATAGGAQGPVARSGPASSRPSAQNIGQGGDRLNLVLVPDAGNAAAPRGQITLADNRAIVHLFAAADRSTFMHEMGHKFLDELARDAARENVPRQLKDDLGIVLRWLGADRAEDITREQHEKFARGFERYLAEGRAPSNALARAFESFKRWLLEIYHSLAALDAPITDDIRGVMDRLLATDAEIAARENPTFRAIADLPPAVKEDAMRAAVAAVIHGDKVQAADLIEEAAKAEPRIAESLALANARPVEGILGSPDDYGSAAQSPAQPRKDNIGPAAKAAKPPPSLCR